MANRLKFPIRYKILALLGTVVIAAIGLYLYLASKIFYDDKTLLVYELNQSNVRQLAMDVESNIRRTVDKLRLVAALVLSGSSQNSATLAQFTENEDTLVSIKVLRMTNPGTEPIFSRTWPKYLEAYGQNADYLSQVRQQMPVQYDKVLREGLWVRNATLPSVPSSGATGSSGGAGTGAGGDAKSVGTNPPLITIATSIEIQKGGEKSHIVLVADVRADKLIDAFSQSTIARTYAIDSEGFALAHPERDKNAAAESLTSDPIITKALESKVRSQVMQFSDGGVNYLGAFYQTGLAGIVVISKIEAGQAFEAAKVLIKKSLLYAAVIITTAFLIVLFVSHSLTEPMQKMVDATHRIAAGDFSIQVPVSTRDELAALAVSFNQMTVDLKQSHEKIQEYNRELENKVAERTAQLEAKNVAIKEAQEALLRTTRLASVGEVAGRAAHEVLNPLTSIMARLEKIQGQGLSADAKDLQILHEIVQAWHGEFSKGGATTLMKTLLVPSTVYKGKTLLEEDLQNMVNLVSGINSRKTQREDDVLFLLREAGRISKIVNGMRQLTRVSSDRRAIDIHQVIKETVATMTDVLTKRKIKIESKLCASVPPIVSDHDELLQVFTNLVRNSAQAIEDAIKNGKPVGAEPKIWLTSECLSFEGKKHTLVRICDNGPGIPQDKFEIVFEPSYTTKEAGEGTGLGLSISRRFIRASGGELTVEKSIPGVETVFLIQLAEQTGKAEA